MKKRTFCLAMAAVMVFGLTGCGGAQTKGEAATTAESTADTTAADTTAADKACLLYTSMVHRLAKSWRE